MMEVRDDVYPFPDSDIADMLEQLLEKQLIKLPECKRPVQAGKVDDPNYCKYHRVISHPVEKCFVLKELILRESLVQFGTFEPVVVRFHQEVAPEDSQEKERLIEEDDEGWTINENPGVVACHAINATEEESILLRSLEEEGVSKDLSRFNVDDLLSLPQETKTILINALLNSAASSSSAPIATYESTPYCMSIDFLDEDLLLGSNFIIDPYGVKKVEADSNPFSEAESHFADAKFYLKNDSSPEAVSVEVPFVNREDNLQLKSLASKEPHKSIGIFHYGKSEASTSTTKSVILMDEKTSNPPILHYVSLSRRKKGESAFVESPQDLKVDDIEVLKESFTTPLTKITKQEIKIDLTEASLPQRRTKDGFDPKAYKLMAKAGYDFTTHTEFKSLKIHEQPKLSSTQKKLLWEGHAIPMSRKGLGYKSPETICITRKGKEKVVDNNYITVKEVDSMEEKEGDSQRTSAFDRISPHVARAPIFERLSVTEEERKDHQSTSNLDRRSAFESIDTKKKESTSRVSVWRRIKHINVESHHGKEFPCERSKLLKKMRKMPPQSLEDGGQSTVDELKEVNLGTIEEPRPTFISASLSSEEEGKYMSLPGLDPKIEVEINKLIEVGFIREVKYPTWITNIVPVRKKNVQLRVYVDFHDLNNVFPKYDFPLPITEIMVDATTGHEALSFMDGSSGYNQIRMAFLDEEMTAFRTPKGIYCYKVMPFGLENVGATYQRAMQEVFDDMLHKYVECYVDDLVVKSKRRQDHLKDLKVVFDRLQKYQLRMNPLKCAFDVTSGKFLGFIVRHQGIEIDQSKIDAIQKMSRPKSLHDLRSLQGRLAYI
ncbi:uncharacterized protein E5676_scaffold195G001240 [Cucumis melo var. makuwa]|uniref:Reverse transcriptase domain-containing protein n=1 Tax=Cucumis melo var. makuwa TaxID=1194695 RepID=A0A5D3DGT6_CUCMM|nr:uncharacterized protein E5676_scaffold195G001240 [Cucumis melo var. makuwa]